MRRQHRVDALKPDAIEQTQLPRQHRVDSFLLPKFYFHTDGTMLMFGFDCAARMTRRPILPKPLIPTRIDMVFFCDLRVDGVSCGCAVFGGSGRVSGDPCFRAAGARFAIAKSVAQRCWPAKSDVRGQRVRTSAKHKAQPLAATSVLCDASATGQAAQLLSE